MSNIENNTVVIPVPLMLAAEKCACDEEARYYLRGVYIHRQDGQLRIVATDGHVMFVSEIELDGETPAWLDEGIIISRENLPQMVKMIERLNGDGRLFLSYDEGRDRCTLSDGMKVASFRPEVVDGKFPDYQAIINKIPAFEARETREMESVSLAPSIMRRATDVAKVLDGKEATAIRFFTSADSANVMTFRHPGCFMVAMPTNGIEPGFAPATARLLAPAVQGTLAALKAHRTRAEKAGHKAKVAEYDERIKAIVDGYTPPAVEHQPAAQPEAEKSDAKTEAEAKPDAESPKADAAATEHQRKPEHQAPPKPVAGPDPVKGPAPVAGPKPVEKTGAPTPPTAPAAATNQVRAREARIVEAAKKLRSEQTAAKRPEPANRGAANDPKADAGRKVIRKDQRRNGRATHKTVAKVQ